MTEQEAKDISSKSVHIASEDGFQMLRELIQIIHERQTYVIQMRSQGYQDEYAVIERIDKYNKKIKYLLNL